MTIMKADDVKKITIEAYKKNEKVNKYLKDIENKILVAAAKGEYEVSVPSAVGREREMLVQNLMEAGYTVTVKHDHLLINWESKSSSYYKD